MKNKTKNKLLVSALVAMVLPIITVSIILPRISIVTELTGDGQLRTEVYDVYLADYSKDPDSESYRFTLKVLLDMRNPYKNKKIVIPRLNLELDYLNKSVGKLWSNEELILEPFKDENSDSAGLLPLYLTLYVGGDSGLVEFINGLFSNKLGALDLDLSLLLGDVPINIDAILGEVFALIGGSDTGALDVNSLLETLGGSVGGEDLVLPENYIFLKNNSKIQDVRALLNKVNSTIFPYDYENLILGAKDKFSSVHWENASNGNYAIGNGNYSWEYWDGSTWKSLSVTDGSNKFSKTGEITFTEPNDWEKIQILETFPEYYFIQCNVIDLDTGINRSGSEYVRMNVRDSYINDYKPPSQSAVSDNSGSIKPQAEEEIEYPELSDYELPLDKGLLQTDLEIDEYFKVNNLDFDNLLNTYILGIGQEVGVLYGLEKTFKLPWVNGTDDDEPSGGLELDAILVTVFSYLVSHNIGLGEFFIMCELDWEGTIDYIGQNFNGFTAPNGTNLFTGEYIYSPVSGTNRYNTTIIFSFAIFIGLLIALGVIAPYLAQRKVDQSFVFEEISNLENYIDKVKKEMEKGISEEEIDLLKKATFKKKSILNKEKGDQKE